MIEQTANLSHEEVQELIKEWPYRPTGRAIVTTVNTTELDPDNPDLSAVDFSEWQYVIAVGKNVDEFKAGDYVCLALEKMTREVPADENSHEKKMMLAFQPIEYKDRFFAKLYDSYVDLVYEG